MRGQPVHRLLGQLAVGGELAAEHVEQGRTVARVQFQQIVAGDLGGVVLLIVEQRAHAAVAPHHVVRGDLLAEVAIGCLAQITRLLAVDARCGRVGVVVDVGGADQGVVLLVRNGENDAPVRLLEDVGMVVLEQPRHHDVAALDQAQRVVVADVRHLVQELHRPRSGGVDQRPRAQFLAAAVGVLQLHLPHTIDAARADTAGPGEDARAALGGVHRIEHHQPRVLHPGVGIDETGAELLAQRRAHRVRAQRQASRARKGAAAAAQVVVQEQAGADHPRRAQMRLVRQQEAERPDDVRGQPQQHLALGQGLADQGELVLLQVAQAAMDQLGAGAGGMRGQVVALAQAHRQAAAHRVAGDAHAVDAATDHQHIVDLTHSRLRKCRVRLGNSGRAQN
ncbi:hypothetical protein NB713_001143 [Xanthomonas sacchari]|nr:hypothetical protein [Xanthomonas sacchari]